MPKKVLLFLSIVPIILSGCGNSRQIENAAVIENVSVNTRDGKLFYTFYPLTDGETPEAVEISAESFEAARKLAEDEYIPNMTLAKLELLLIHEDVDPEIMRGDIEYISTQASFSPVAYVAVCDSGALEKIGESTGARETVEKQIILCENNNPEVNSDYLSVFNRYAEGDVGDFRVPYITAGEELKVSTVKIEKNEK